MQKVRQKLVPVWSVKYLSKSKVVFLSRHRNRRDGEKTSYKRENQFNPNNAESDYQETYPANIYEELYFLKRY